MNDERSCPVCRSDAYLNPCIVIFISPCFHKMCESCVLRIFSSGQAPCPECNTPLRKINFTSPTFEDIQVEKECKLRNTLSRAFHRELEEFEGDVEKYNDYLEEFENLVFYLMDLKSLGQVREKISEIQNLGKDSILNPKSKTEQPKSEPTAKRRLINKDIQESEENEEKYCFSNYFDPKDLPSLRIKFSKKIILPDAYLKPFGPGGMTKDLILSYAVKSLDNFNI